MFSFEILESDDIVVLTFKGHISIDDYQDVAPKFLHGVKLRNIRRLLLDWRKFDGWKSEEAPSISFFSWLEIQPLFDRIAIVFHDGVRNEVDRFEEFFRNADKEVRRFRPDRYEAALDWLKAENGESRLD